MYQRWLVILAELQKVKLNHLHEGYWVIIKHQALTCENVWWPGLSKQITDKVRRCGICEKERKHPPKSRQPTQLPEWQKVGIDLFKLKRHRYLLIIDHFSRLIEIIYRLTITSTSMTENCKSIFTMGAFLSWLGFAMELWTQPFTRSTGVLCSRSTIHTWVQVLSCVNYYSMLLSLLTRIEPAVQR